jgi:hypothetical protein
MSEPRYGLRYPGSFLEDVTYTFPQLCHLMRVVPITASLEILLPNGDVHFTLPRRTK